jgi:hypothetical protein
MVHGEAVGLRSGGKPGKKLAVDNLGVMITAGYEGWYLVKIARRGKVKNCTN